MPQDMTDEDFRIELLIWILIDAFSRFPGYVDQIDFDQAVARYERLLKEKEVEIKLYPSIVTGRYPEARNAAIRAIEYKILAPQNAGSSRARIIGSVDMFLRKTTLLTKQEILAAKEAARAAAHP